MSDPNTILNASTNNPDYTVVISVLAVCLTAMGTLVAIFRKKIREDEKPGNSLFCIQQKEDLNKLETFTKENYKQIEKNKEEDIKKFEELKQLVNDTNKEVVILKTQAENTSTSLIEMKRDVKDVASKLDSLLKQLFDWMSE